MMLILQSLAVVLLSMAMLGILALVLRLDEAEEVPEAEKDILGSWLAKKREEREKREFRP